MLDAEPLGHECKLVRERLAIIGGKLQGSLAALHLDVSEYPQGIRIEQVRVIGRLQSSEIRCRSQVLEQ